MVGRVTAGDETQSGPDPLGAARDAAGAAGERLGNARAEAGERFGAARDAATKQVAAARETAALAAHGVAHKLSQKPRLRGVSHQWAFFVSLGAGAALVLLANGSKATVAAAIYAFSLSALLGPTKDPEEPWLVLTGGDEPIGVAVAHLEGHLNVPRASLLTAPGGDARSIHVREHVRDGAVTRGIVDLVTLAGEIQKHQGPAGPGKER